MVARVWTGVVLLAAIIFGSLAYAALLLITWHPWASLAITLAVWLGGSQVSRLVAWLVMLGTPAPVPVAAPDEEGLS